MLIAERRRLIAERLQAAGRVVVSELSAGFGVSEETIRRDLEWLESEGVAKRTYGGAVPCGGGKAPPPYAVRKNTNVEGKLVIAIMAKGHFTSGGHFIVLRGVTEDGNILVADPASVKRSNQEWALGIITNEASRKAGSGGPFWVFSA